MSLVAYGESSGSDCEEPSKPPAGSGEQGEQDIKKFLSVLPALRKNQPVRLGIALPSRLKDDSDSDDDDSSVPKKKGTGSRLTSLLPPPKQASKVVKKGTTASTSASMVPYSLTRRPTSQSRKQKKSMPSKKAARPSQPGVGEGSDSDEEPTSFFSHLESTVLPEATFPQSISQHTSQPSPSLQLSQPLSEQPSPATQPPPQREEPSQWTAVSCSSSNGGGGPAMYNAAPSAPKPFSIRDDGGFTHELPDPVLLGEWGQEDTQQSSETEQVRPALGAGPGLSMDADTYRRLTGGKRKRGRDPSLNDLIEINEDEVKVEMENYRRHYSDDTVDKLYKPPEGEKPTGQQKRKHQLTYLAHEAKANELKLLKQWGQAAATRRDTQMKYGF